MFGAYGCTVAGIGRRWAVFGAYGCTVAGIGRRWAVFGVASQAAEHTVLRVEGTDVHV